MFVIRKNRVRFKETSMSRWRSGISTHVVRGEFPTEGPDRKRWNVSEKMRWSGRPGMSKKTRGLRTAASTFWVYSRFRRCWFVFFAWKRLVRHAFSGNFIRFQNRRRLRRKRTTDSWRPTETGDRRERDTSPWFFPSRRFRAIRL